MGTDVVPGLEIIEGLYEDLIDDTDLVDRIDQRLLSPVCLDWISKRDLEVESVEDVEIEDDT
jgi:hypothetical protein